MILDLFRISDFVLRICFGFRASDFGFAAKRPHHDFVAASAADDPEGAAIAALGAQAAVDRIVGALTPEQAEVVLLRVLGGLAVSQVADVLGKQPSAVRVLQHRALRRLAQHFPPETDQ